MKIVNPSLRIFLARYLFECNGKIYLPNVSMCTRNFENKLLFVNLIYYFFGIVSHFFTYFRKRDFWNICTKTLLFFLHCQQKKKQRRSRYTLTRPPLSINIIYINNVDFVLIFSLMLYFRRPRYSL